MVIKTENLDKHFIAKYFTAYSLADDLECNNHSYFLIIVPEILKSDFYFIIIIIIVTIIIIVIVVVVTYNETL